MALRAPDTVVGPFRERDTVVLSALVMDNATPPAAIPGSALTSATFTLYSEHGTQAIINGRDHTDIKPNIDGTGRFSLSLSGADMAIVDAQATEFHRALLEWVWDTDKRGSWEIRIVVRDVNRVA